MAQPTALNDPVTDAVAQTGVMVAGEAAAVSIAALYQSLAHSTALLYEGAAAQYQRSQVLGLAASNQGVIQLYSIGTIAGAVAAGRIAAAAREGPSLLQLVAAARALHSR